MLIPYIKEFILDWKIIVYQNSLVNENLNINKFNQIFIIHYY